MENAPPSDQFLHWIKFWFLLPIDDNGVPDIEVFQEYFSDLSDDKLALQLSDITHDCSEPILANRSFSKYLCCNFLSHSLQKKKFLPAFLCIVEFLSFCNKITVKKKCVISKVNISRKISYKLSNYMFLKQSVLMYRVFNLKVDYFHLMLQCTF